MSIINTIELEECKGCPYVDVEVKTRHMREDGKFIPVDIVAKCRHYDMCSRIREKVNHG